MEKTWYLFLRILIAQVVGCDEFFCMDSLDLYRIKLRWIVLLSRCAGCGGNYVGAVDGLPGITQSKEAETDVGDVISLR